MIYKEKIINFHCDDDLLFGILALPSSPSNVGVLVVVGGPQYRVGSHRQFLQLSRVMATSGFAVFRFDVRGMGDSEGELKGFQHISLDIEAAKKAFLLAVPYVKTVVLWGLCDGASAALLYCHHYKDPQVSGLCLLNPWIRSEKSLALSTIKNYYTKRFIELDFWRKLIRGGILKNAVFEFFINIKKILISRIKKLFSGIFSENKILQKKEYQNHMAQAWSTFEGKILLFLSKNDFVAKEFIDHINGNNEWNLKNKSLNYTCYEIASADHTFTDFSAQNFVEEKTIQWIKSF